MKTFKILTITLALFCFNSCKENSVSDNDKKEFYPLSVGNYWNYQTITFDSVGNEISQGSFTLEKVTGDTTLRGERCYFLEQRFSPDSWFSAPYRNSAEGLIMQVDSTFTKYPLIYKYPAQVNEVFSDSIKIISVEEVISSVAGNLKCIVYQKFFSSRNTPFSSGWICINTYVVPGFGKIRMDGLYTSDKIIFRKISEYRLVDYKIN